MKIIDLSTPFDMKYSIPQPPPMADEIEIKFRHTKSRDGFYSTKFTLITHMGTHIDAPMHRFERDEKQGMYYLEDIPLEQLYGETVVLDIPKGELEAITADDLEKAEPKVCEGDIVLVHTGWGRYFEEEPKNAFYLFTKRPGLEIDGAEWLVKKRVKAYGQDTIGTQHPKYSFFLSQDQLDAGLPRVKEPVHDMLLSNDIILIEHLTNLDKICGKRVVAGFFPLPFKGIDGCPIRALAFLEE